MSTRCSCSPMRNTLQRRLSSLSSEAEYSCTDFIPFWSSSVVLGLGRSSERRGVHSWPHGHLQLPGGKLAPSFKHLYGWFLEIPLMHVNRLVSSLTFGFHAFCLNQRQESLKGPPGALWKGEFFLQHMSQWMDHMCWWCHVHSDDVNDLQDVTLKPQCAKKRRRNENRDSNQRICWHLWLAPCYICSPNIRSKINTQKMIHNSSFKGRKTNTHLFLYKITATAFPLPLSTYSMMRFVLTPLCVLEMRQALK